MAPELAAPVLIQLREAKVETVDLMKVSRNGDGSIDLLADAMLAPQGAFQVNNDRTGIIFSVDGQGAELKEKPPLIGLQEIAALEEHSPEYRRTAEAYTPSNPIVASLKEQSADVRVRVFFGSWCSACKQMVPRIIKVAEQLNGSKIDFEFYGLPIGISGDPEAKKLGITGVPTGVIFRGDEEIGRISGAGWKVPELAINSTLAKAGS